MESKSCVDSMTDVPSAIRDGYKLQDLYCKLIARGQALNAADVPHRLSKDWDTLKADYVPDEAEKDRVDELLKDVKKRKQASWALPTWYEQKYYETFRQRREEVLKLLDLIEKGHRSGNLYNHIMSMDRFDYRDVEYDWFVRNYEIPSKPCLISGFADSWPINSFNYRYLSESHFKDCQIKVGKDDDGYAIRLPMKDYVHYAARNIDDSPVYLFESQLAADKNLKRIFDTFSRPVWFQRDFFDLCHAGRRPPHRWLCLGPERSGTTMHTDPLNTNAWNTVISGRKIWILFPPGTPEEVAKGTQFMSKPRKSYENEAIGWYFHVYPKLRQWCMDNGNKYGLQEVIQYPGETIFVPGSWWHYVINLDDCLAVTMNYCNYSNLPLVWRDMRVERRHIARRWMANLELRDPKAFAMMQSFNQEDNWEFTFSKPSRATRRPFICERLASSDLPAEQREKLEKQLQEATDLPYDRLPFAYSGWSDVSGEDDTSSDDSSSDSSSDSDSDDDEKDGTTEEERKLWVGLGEAAKHRDPAFDTFVGSKFEPIFIGKELDNVRRMIRNTRKRKFKAPPKEWNKYHVARWFPRFRDALVAWADHVERYAPYLPATVARDAASGVVNALSSKGVKAEQLTLDHIKWILPESADPKIQRMIQAITERTAVGFPDMKSSDADVKAQCKIATGPDSLAGVLPLPRIHYKDITYEHFQERFERPLQPCLIDGMMEGWPMNDYTAESLSTGKYADVKFKVGRDREGYRLTLKMKHFIHDLATTRDDAPLYLFEPQLETIPIATEMQQDYTRPNFFERDLLDLVRFSRRPPQRWLTIGAQNSGTLMHLDPLNTNAWNALVHGRKYWLLMSPNTPKDVADGTRFLKRARQMASAATRLSPEELSADPSFDDLAATWYRFVLPQLREFVAASKGEYILYESIHYPGETIFVPGNWWHAVLNLDDTVAITQNYCNESNFASVWPAARKRRKHMTTRWLKALEEKYPSVAEEAKAMDGEIYKAAFKFSAGSVRRKAERNERRAKHKERLAQLARLKAEGGSLQEIDRIKIEDEDEFDRDDHGNTDESSGEWDSSTCTDDEAGSLSD